MKIQRLKVLLLEAGGPDTQKEIHIPAAFSKLFKTACDWTYFTEPEPHLDNRSLYWPRGKVLGGSSSINAMIYIRGHRWDYDHWRELGNPGWDYESVLPYFKKSEAQENGPPHFMEQTVHCMSPICAAPILCLKPLYRPPNRLGSSAIRTLMLRSRKASGHIRSRSGKAKRCSAAAAFLHPVMRRPNLTLKTGVQVFDIIFEEERAIAVSFQQGENSAQEHADREIILCGGSVASPHLLMLAGVGPADHLRDSGCSGASRLAGRWRKPARPPGGPGCVPVHSTHYAYQRRKHQQCCALYVLQKWHAYVECG